MSHGIYSPGKVDYNGSGRRNCRVSLCWSLNSGRFSMSAEIWNPRETDCYTCGQCVEEAARFFRGDRKVQRMLAIWRDWHLNDLTAGSPSQESWLKTIAATHDAPKASHYEWACENLARVGLNPDPNYIRNGAPYAYGSAWLTRVIPPEIIAEIESWSEESTHAA